MKHRRPFWLGRFGLRRPRRGVGLNLAVELVVLAVVVWAAAVGWRAVHHSSAGITATQEQKQALAIADAQLVALRASNGLALGEQCFDTQGNPRSNTDAGAPCSYYPRGKKSGCLASEQSQCYAVLIAPKDFNGSAEIATVPVTYEVSVAWSGVAGAPNRVALNYQLVQSNPLYNINQTSSGSVIEPGSSGPYGSLQGVAAGVGLSGGPLIANLSDLYGGATVSVNGAACVAANSCQTSSSSYNLSAVFAMATNVPDALLASCTWDFGDGSALQTIAVGESGCSNGQMVSHDYRSAWQLQNLPPYPDACLPPKGQDLDTHAFLVQVTLHSTTGVDVATKSPYRVVLPGC